MPFLPLPITTTTPPSRQNHELVPGRTLVVGTEQGLFARVRRLPAPLLRLRSTRDDGSTEERELPLDEAALAEVRAVHGFQRAVPAERVPRQHGEGGRCYEGGWRSGRTLD